jgi:hypothetical protein
MPEYRTGYVAMRHQLPTDNSNKVKEKQQGLAGQQVLTRQQLRAAQQESARRLSQPRSRDNPSERSPLAKKRVCHLEGRVRFVPAESTNKPKAKKANPSISTNERSSIARSSASNQKKSHQSINVNPRMGRRSGEKETQTTASKDTSNRARAAGIARDSTRRDGRVAGVSGAEMSCIAHPPAVRHIPGLCELEAIPAIVPPPYEAFPLLAC